MKIVVRVWEGGQELERAAREVAESSSQEDVALKIMVYWWDWVGQVDGYTWWSWRYSPAWTILWFYDFMFGSINLAYYVSFLYYYYCYYFLSEKKKLLKLFKSDIKNH